MKYLVGLFFVFSFVCTTRAQQSAEVLEQDNSTLRERYYLMKENSQTFKDYKVIKEYVLDGMWKITMDSIKAQHERYKEANASIATLENQLKGATNTIAEKDATIADMEHDSSHISVLGIDLPKTLFISMTGIIIVGLLVLSGVLFTRVRWVHKAIKERTEVAEVLTRDFEEYKRKALDKQMKLSRELQNERNKLQELRST